MPPESPRNGAASKAVDYLLGERVPTPAMAETVHVELPRRELGETLAATLGERGFHAELVDEGATCGLAVRYALDERQRLIDGVAHAVESWVGDNMLPLVVERMDGTCVVRPPAE
jgi:hypothetical protein